ncbi:hypothetical protein AAVH_41497, partial [Aphelenchoides avenae]
MFMCLALFTVPLYALAALRSVTSQYPLAVGGHGKFFYKPGIPVANARVWVEVFSPSEWILNKPLVWTNATFANENVSEVRVHPVTGEYELEAIVGDASRRGDVKAIRIFFERVHDVIGDSCDCQCFGRDLGLEYMYLYKPDRNPSRPFRYDVMLYSPEPNDKDQALVSVDEKDSCFHRRLAADAKGRLTCTATTPMVNASVWARVKISGSWSKGVLTTSKYITDANGTYDVIVWVGEAAVRHSVDEILLVINGTCSNL